MIIYTVGSDRYIYDHKRRALLKAFDETAHPRDVHGRFVSTLKATEADGVKVLKTKGDRFLAKIEKMPLNKLLNIDSNDAVETIYFMGLDAIASKMEKGKDRELAEYSMDTDQWDTPELDAERDRLKERVEALIERRVNEED